MKHTTPCPPTHTEHSIPCPRIDGIAISAGCIMHITPDTADALNSHAEHAKWKRLLEAGYLDGGDALVAAVERRVGE